MGEEHTSTSSRRYRRRTVRALDHSIDGHRGPQSTKPSTHGRRTSSITQKKNVLLQAQQLPVFVIPPQFPKEWIVSNSLVILIEFLLFSRGLFPLPVAEIHETAQVQPRCPRKVLLASSQVQTLTRHILSLCADNTQSFGTGAYCMMGKTLQSASFLMISLGPSRMRCQEFYLLDLREWPTKSKEEDGPNASSQALRPNARLPPREVLARRLLPRWMSAEIPSLPSHSHKFQLYLSLWMNPQQQEAYYNDTVGAPPSTGDFTDPSLVGRPDAAQKMPVGSLSTEWIPCSSPFPRQGQHYSSRRQPSLVIQSIAPATYASENREGAVVPWTDLPFFQLDPPTTTGPPTWSTVGQWLTLRSPVKGFRLDH